MKVEAIRTSEPISIGNWIFRIEERLVEHVVLYRVTSEKPRKHYTAKTLDEARAYLIGLANGVKGSLA